MCTVHDIKGQTVTESNSYSRYTLTQHRTAVGLALFNKKAKEGILTLLLSLLSTIVMDRKKANLSISGRR